MDFLKQLGNMQEMFQSMQDEITNITLSGDSGGGAVKITIDLQGKIRDLEIDPTMMGEGNEAVLADLIISAYNNVHTKVQARMHQELGQKLAEKMPMGMKFPGT
ncbi:MAG: YbaB/EbfC family nucleoid-associated protein [Pseudomonadota bacterium]